jgi:hypothetical protein
LHQVLHSGILNQRAKYIPFHVAGRIFVVLITQPQKNLSLIL